MHAEVQFHPAIEQWFTHTYPGPTPVQLAAWPEIAAGHHALITAPTGSGKTLTAFLWALNQFTLRPPDGHTRVLYISPLKALNNDIHRNLLEPLQTLKAEGAYPDVRVAVRSGDTSQSERTRLLRKPPDVLITTPESLGLMLTTTKGRIALSHVETVIMDEVHSLIDNRRGVQLMVNIERLVDLAGEFQRIALSATVNPLATVASYMAGFNQAGTPRAVRIVNPPADKAIDLKVRFPSAARDAAEQGKKIWDPLSEEFKAIIAQHQATLFFTNSRRLAEKITLKINETESTPLAYAHHGSLAREVRNSVEGRLKDGELQAIVATNSLEMGIDIGHLDEVVMVQSPPGIASALQRIGRAGHQVGETSRGTLYPTHAQDFLEAAALADAVAERDIEPLQPLRGALDVLAQIVVSCCAAVEVEVDELFQLIKRASPYRDLSREHFDLIISMLCGRYGTTRVRELKPRLNHDRIRNTLSATRGAVLALYNSGGTIPDRGYFKLRHADSGAVLGELDEEFVWEATVGDRFTLGTQHWQIHRITHNDVMVRQSPQGTAPPPFWRSESFHRSYHFSQRIAKTLESFEHALPHTSTKELVQAQCDERGFDSAAAEELIEFLQAQREHTGQSLPHRHHLLLEHIRTGPAGYGGPNNPQQLVIHTCWGGRLNQPYALALKTAWKSLYPGKVDIHADNDAIVLQCMGEIDPHQLVTLVRSDNVLTLLRTSLEGSGFFGARFRECAGRALLLTKQRFNQRLPLWMSRMQAKKLMAQVKILDDFPILLETWRTCLDDEFDLPNLIAMLQELEQGTITWSLAATTSPSPFARGLTFGQVSRYMYADDTPDDEDVSALSDDLISQALHNDALRPSIDPQIAELFEQKRQRRHTGYEPESPSEWAEWTKERILIPWSELPDPVPEHQHLVRITEGSRAWLTHRELLSGLATSGFVPAQWIQVDYPAVLDERSSVEYAHEVLSFYGPRSQTDFNSLLPTVPEGLWQPSEALICGALITGREESYWCDAENLEHLLRLQRAHRRIAFEARPCEELPLFWAALHRLGSTADTSAIRYAAETLRMFPASVSSYTEDLFATRLQGFSVAHLEQLQRDHDIAWRGFGEQQLTVGYPEDFDLFGSQEYADEEQDLAAFFTDANASYRFDEIAERANMTPAALNTRWWPLVWSGILICSDWQPLLEGQARGYALPDISSLSARRRRQRSSPRGWSGHWSIEQQRVEATDPLSQLEANKDRVRLLLDRYGFICRELVNREAISVAGKRWRWRDAFGALRIMELAGEVQAGYFFEHLSSPQFIAPSAFSLLQSNTLRRDGFWLSALDPVSPSGLSLPWAELPHRRAGNYLVFHNSMLAMVLSRHGKSLQFLIPAEQVDFAAIIDLLLHMLNKQGKLLIEEINGEAARHSLYLEYLQPHLRVVRDHKNVYIEREI